MSYKIYKYTSPSSKIYIGQTNRSLEKRANHGEGYIHSTYFYAAIKKYGFENFKVEILKDNLTLEEANYWEVYYINFFDSTNRLKGYNISKGGDNRTLSKEARLRSSERMKKNNPMKNPEIAKKVSKKNKGRKLSEEAKQNISNGHKKRLECIETGEIFESCQQAGKKYNVDPTNISRAARGITQTSAKMHWRYL